MPLPNHDTDLFQGTLPAAGDGPVEDLNGSSKQLVHVMTAVKGSRARGHRTAERIFKSHAGVVNVWRTEGSKYLLRAWSTASQETRSAFKRSLETFNASLQGSTESNPAILPSFRNMRIFLAPPPVTRHPFDLALAHLATPPRPADNPTAEEARMRSVPTQLPFDPAYPDRVREERSLARTPRPLLGLRAAARYGLNKERWERQARVLYQ
ncbi:hypothetical protein JCM9279_007036 [Rhodotorula babjevae]